MTEPLLLPTYRWVLVLPFTGSLSPIYLVRKGGGAAERPWKDAQSVKLSSGVFFFWRGYLKQYLRGPEVMVSDLAQARWCSKDEMGSVYSAISLTPKCLSERGRHLSKQL